MYDRVERGEFHRHGELRLAMDTYGITPKGQQDRRWRPPKAEDDEAAVVADVETLDRWANLRVVDSST